MTSGSSLTAYPQLLAKKIDIVDMNITFATSVGGRCLGADPGSAYVCGKIDALETLTPEMGKTVYRNLAKHYISAKTEEPDSEHTKRKPVLGSGRCS